MAKLRERIDYWHNVIAPNSFRKRMARLFVDRMVEKYGESVGAVYLAGSTASKRAMQDSSVNLVVMLKSEGAELEKQKVGINRLARSLDTLGARSGGGWYFTPLVVRAAPENYTPDLLQPEKVLIYGKEFANSEGLPLKVKSPMKRGRYVSEPKFDVKPTAFNARVTDPLARRPLLGIPRRLKIERVKRRV
jgi:hypothetical protein